MPRLVDQWVSSPKRHARIAPTIGTEAISRAASELEMRCSAHVSARKVNVISTRAKAVTHRQCPRRSPNWPFARTMGSRTRAPRRTRTKTMNPGSTEVTATLMSR